MSKLVGRWVSPRDLGGAVTAFLLQHGCAHTAVHCEQVSAEAARLARRLGLDAAEVLAVEMAGWLHDISAIIPVAQRVETARRWGIHVLLEEEAAPMILHQKLSAEVARQEFQIDDPDILDAIACHTTLKQGASMLDKVVFLADKLAWDQPGIPPYQAQAVAALDVSLDQAVFCYLDYLWQQKERLAVIHPWFVGAYRECVCFISVE